MRSNDVGHDQDRIRREQPPDAFGVMEGLRHLDIRAGRGRPDRFGKFFRPVILCAHHLVLLCGRGVEQPEQRRKSQQQKEHRRLGQHRRPGRAWRHRREPQSDTAIAGEQQGADDDTQDTRADAIGCRHDRPHQIRQRDHQQRQTAHPVADQFAHGKLPIADRGRLHHGERGVLAVTVDRGRGQRGRQHDSQEQQTAQHDRVQVLRPVAVGCARRAQRDEHRTEHDCGNHEERHRQRDLPAGGAYPLAQFEADEDADHRTPPPEPS